MIRINLLGEEIVSDHSGHMVVAGYVGSLVATLVLGLYLSSVISGDIEALTGQRQGLERELTLIKETTKEVRDLEKRRDDLKAKLTVIALLRKSKTGPVRVLDELNSAIPDRAWVTDVQEKGGQMKILGMAIDNITVSNFAKQLQESEYFPSVEILESKSVTWRESQVRQFTLQTKVNYAGRILPVVSTGSVPGSTEAVPGMSAEQSDKKA